MLHVGQRPADHTESLALATEDGLVELIPEEEFASYKQIHDEVERWLFHNEAEKKDDGYETSRASRTLTTFAEASIVRQENLATFVNDQVAEMVRVCSREAQAKLSSDLRRVLLTDETCDTFHRVHVEDSLGGSNLFEKFLFRHKTLPNGNHAILFAYFGDKQDLARTWKFYVANHDVQKLNKWLDYKLFERLKAKGRSFLPRRRSVYLTTPDIDIYPEDSASQVGMRRRSRSPRRSP